MTADQDYKNWEAEEERDAKLYEKERSERRARAEATCRARQKAVRKLALMAAAGAALVVLLIVVVAGAAGNPVKKELQIEAGEPMPTARDFLKNPNSKREISLLTDLSEITTNHVSETEVIALVNGKERRSKLIIVDTVAPTAEASPVNVSAGMEVMPYDLVKNAVDATALTFEFETPPDVTTLGVKDTTVVVTDEGGNQIRVTTQVVVVNDTEAPVISGVAPLQVMAGESVDYLANVTVSDDIDHSVELRVDTSGVDLNKAGAYQIVYRAVDQAGNAAEVGTVLIVDQMTDDYVDPAEIYQYADKALAETIRGDMTPAQKAYAIYGYVRSHLWYTSPYHGESWTASALMGFRDKGGDAYVFSAMSRALLTRAGIDNITVDRKNEDDDPHQWNLVNCGTGWYHFDATARSDGTEIFMWTDAQLDAYSAEHSNSHVRDTELYPATPEESFNMDSGTSEE